MNKSNSKGIIADKNLLDVTQQALKDSPQVKVSNYASTKTFKQSKRNNFETNNRNSDQSKAGLRTEETCTLALVKPREATEVLPGYKTFSICLATSVQLPFGERSKRTPHTQMA